MNLPLSITERNGINLKQGIKSSLSNLRSVISFAYLLYTISNNESEVIYSEEYVTSNKLIRVKTRFKNKICSFFNLQPEDIFIENTINNNPLFVSQIESLQVAFELFFKLATVKFVDEKNANTCERLGGNRYKKKICFSTNMIILDIVMSSINDKKEFIHNWLLNKQSEDKIAENNIMNLLTIFTEETRFKIRVSESEDLYFQQEGIYQKILLDGKVDSKTEMENVGPYRIYRSYIKEGLHPFIIEEGGYYKTSDEKSLSNYSNMVSNTLDLIPQRSYSEQNSIEKKIKKIENNIPYIKYLAAIKSKPFLLLAGISGTGKSRIVRQLARACDKFDNEPWEVQKPYNYEMISVKPNWHDSTELLGYVSRVSGESEYIVTDFLKFIAMAWMHEDKPFFLCLDEMNLAPVEQYFAEFLSKMESRKVNNETNVITSDPLLYFSSSDDEEKKMTKNMINKMFSNLVYFENSSENEEAYHSRLESLKEQFKNEGISIPRNLIVIGTVNMDETTYTFSRKVLDRAMTIEMNDVRLTEGLNKGKDRLPDIAPEQILPDAVEGYDFYEENSEVCDYVIEYLEKINEKLESTPFKIAYRTRNDCMLYVVSSLKLCEESEGLTKDKIRDRALDEVTSMKILSRIEGDKKKVGETLSELEKVIWEQFGFTESDENSTKSVSLNKIKEMNDRLTNTYYCSFWS